MLRTLRPYQAEAVEFLLSNPRAALFMEMRLGKTLCVIRAMQQLRTHSVLVVVPMVGIWAWKRELDLEGEEPPAVLLGSVDQRLALSNSATWNLINYEGLRACPQLLQCNWGAVVLDESRRIANPKARITAVLQRFANPNTRRIILSGNPAPEGPQEFFEQMRWLHGRFVGCTSYWQFRYAFFSQVSPYEWLPRNGAVDRIKSAVHKNAYVLTRKQAGIESEKIYERRVVQMPAEAKRAYAQALREFIVTWNGIEKTTKWVPVQYLWLQQIASGNFAEGVIHEAKHRELEDLLTQELHDETVVVWFRFNAGLLEAKRRLVSRKVKVATILGSASQRERADAIDAFRRGEVRVLLCQIKAAKEAIDLSTSSTAIYFSNSHSLDERVQSEDRILNPAKKDPLLYIDLVAGGTVDEDIVDLLQDKKRDARFFLHNLLQRLFESNEKKKATSN